MAGFTANTMPELGNLTNVIMKKKHINKYKSFVTKFHKRKDESFIVEIYIMGYL